MQLQQKLNKLLAKTEYFLSFFLKNKNFILNYSKVKTIKILAITQ